MNHIVVMGRKTFDEIGKPLKDRINIVITSDESFSVDGVIRVSSWEEVYPVILPYSKTVFVIGGESVYQQAMEDADEIILTEIVDAAAKQQPTADKFFPAISFDINIKDSQYRMVDNYKLSTYVMERLVGESL